MGGVGGGDAGDGEADHDDVEGEEDHERDFLTEGNRHAVKDEDGD